LLLVYNSSRPLQKLRDDFFLLIGQPCPRLPKTRPFWAKILHLLTLLTLPALFVSGCANIGGSVKTIAPIPPVAPLAPPPSLPPPPAPPTPAPVSPPSITTNPVSESVTVGNSGIFVVAAASTEPLTYQWQKNGVVIPDATLPTYVTPPTRLSDDGSIFVAVVSNSAGSLMSSPAMLSVVAGTPRLTTDASTLSFGNVVVGSSSTMSVTFTNSGNAVATIASVGIAPQAFSSPSALKGSTISPGQSAILTVVFTPPNAAAFSGAITIVSDAANSPITIPISGAGVPTPAHSVTLSWNPSNSPGIVGYLVERGDQSGGPYIQLTPTPITALTFTDTAVRASQTYFYIIIAVDATGLTSAPSNEASLTIPTP
jgi:hypothetical protein